MSEVHVVPVGDLVDHDDSGGDGCVCGPDCVYVAGGVVISHHALDGRA